MAAEAALEILCPGCGEKTLILLRRLSTLAVLRCGCGELLLSEDEMRDYRERPGREETGLSR